jgi:hypothetical protein
MMSAETTFETFLMFIATLKGIILVRQKLLIHSCIPRLHRRAFSLRLVWVGHGSELIAMFSQNIDGEPFLEESKFTKAEAKCQLINLK